MGPDEWPPGTIVVPDDIRELDTDVAAYHRELRSAVPRNRWTRYGVVRPLLVLVLVGLATAGSMMALLAPQAPRYAAAQDLASPSAPVGQVGGRLPDEQVLVSGVPVDLRTLRPALLVVVPPRCSCDGLVRALLAQTAQYSLRLVLATHDLPAAEVAAVRDAALGRATVVEDPSGALAAAFGARALVFVHADGLVTQVVHEPSASARYELPLSQLTTPRQVTSRRGAGSSRA